VRAGQAAFCAQLSALWVAAAEGTAGRRGLLQLAGRGMRAAAHKKRELKRGVILGCFSCAARWAYS